MKRTKLADRALPGYSHGEELCNMLTHIAGAALGVVALIWCLILADTPVEIITSIVYSMTMIHSCGNTSTLLPWFADCGFDAVNPLEPTAGVDLASAKKAVGDRVCLVGNIDVTHILVDADKDEVFAAVKQAVADAGKGGGFILAPAHDHSRMSVERMRWMVEAGRRYGNYPLVT